eukprot:jgi/Psemu1/28820/gm1.28820_g
MKLKVDKLLSADFQTRKQKFTTSFSSWSSQIPLQDNPSIVLQPTVALPHLHHKESVIEANHPNLFVQPTPVLLDTVSPSDTDHSLQNFSFHQLTTTHKVEHWDSLIIAPSNYLTQCRVQSCLCICALDHIHEMSFSNPDFYSTCGLVNYDHWRSIGCEGSQLTDQFLASNLIKIPSSVLQRLDPLNILDVVRPGSAIYQRCQPYFEGELIKLFQFVLFHGKSPSIPDARRIIQNTDKFDVLGDDAVVVKATVARMMNFLWHLAQDIQITAKRCPLGGHLSPKSSLFHCVTLVVSQVFPYPCQGKRHRDTLNDSTYAYSQTVAGNWYLKDVGASRTLSMFTMLHSMYKHKDHLSFDQMIELSFIASFYNSPVMVYTILSDFQYSMSKIHPWYQFANSSVRLLGEGVFQGGIESRFQCSSNRKWNAFCTSYCDSNGLVVTTNKDVVDLRLSKILYIGYDLICWMNALKQCGVEHTDDLPIDVLHTKMKSAVKRIQSSSGISGFDFGRFYLSQWLTVMIGLALPESGIHLLQLNILSKGTASFKHFLNPTMKDTASSNVKPYLNCSVTARGYLVRDSATGYINRPPLQVSPVLLRATPPFRAAPLFLAAPSSLRLHPGRISSFFLGIHFSFGHHFRCGNKQWKLNAAFAQTLPNIASLLVVDEDGVETLQPDPIPVVKSLIVAVIVDELPASEVFKAHKQLIALLLSNSAIFCHKKDHGRFGVRDKCGLDNAARRANNGDPIIRLVLTIFSWKFDEDWYPYEFHKVYEPGYGVPLDEAMLQHKTPFHTQTNNKLKFNDKLIKQLKRERNGETVQQVLPPKRKRPKTTRPATGGLNPIKPIESEVEPTVQVPEQCTFESSNNTSPVIIPSDTTDLVHTKMIDSNNVETSLNSTALSDPYYTWTWNYFPNSELVSFRRIRSDSFLCATSSSPPVQRQEKSSIVTAPSNEIATFRRLPKSAPSPSPQSLMYNRLLPSETLAEVTDLPNAAPAYIRSLRSPCRNQLCYEPYYQPALRLSKPHRDALKIKIPTFGTKLFDPPLCGILDPIHIKPDMIEPVLVPIGHRFNNPDDIRLVRSYESTNCDTKTSSTN